MPYQPTWNNPYLQQTATTYPQVQPYQQQANIPVTVQPMSYQPTGGVAKVDGPSEATNRFLMRYPASVLVPGFVSDALFDVNGRQFHTLSIEPDGRRNLETFDFQPHVEERSVEINGVEFASKREFDELAAKVNAILEGSHGLYATVPAAATAAEPVAAAADVPAVGAGRHAERAQ